MLMKGRDADVLKRLWPAAAKLGSLEVRGRAACSKRKKSVNFQLRLDPGWSKGTCQKDSETKLHALGHFTIRSLP